MIDLSIIIVSWNVRALLEKCLRSIEQDLTPTLSSKEREFTFEVFVVDNASTDGTVGWLTNYELGIRNNTNDWLHNSLFIILNSQNKGFSAANNQAIEQSTGEYVLLLNPDTELKPYPWTSPLPGPAPARPAFGPSPARRGGNWQGEGTLGSMIAFMQSHLRCGVLGPRLLNTDGSLQRSIRRFPDAWSPTLMSLGMTPKKYLALHIDYAKPQIVDQVMGACLLTRRSVIENIGMLDERFFIWFEEVDFCKRAKDAGWEVWYTPDAAVMHHGGQSFAQAMTLKKQWWFSRSLLHYFWKHRQFGAFIVNLITTPVRLLISIFL
ncbi:glycosyltransferase family 2 protein [Candidatus Uhrbacteria bacterium]|nr:glycosyltransferase family 2 protein [Candidatus Uhrbacteria bacterium]